MKKVFVTVLAIIFIANVKGNDVKSKTIEKYLLENVKDDELVLEPWMFNESYWNNEKEDELVLEPWMFDPNFGETKKDTCINICHLDNKTGKK